MAKLNKNFLKLSSTYLFREIEKKCTEFKEKNPSTELLNLGIGDITLPLAKCVIEAIILATKEMGEKTIGYGPSCGYQFLKEKIKQEEYKHLDITEDEIFISYGAKSDSSNIQELFSISSKVAICDPVYPVYVNSNVLAGRTKGHNKKKDRYEDFIYLSCNEENNFSPNLPKTPCDLIYLCSPNNPTGIALTKKELKKWINYAKENNAIIIYDAAYEAFISSKDAVHSIYEIQGATSVAIEIKSFSKTAGFTNLRCSYMVIPKKIFSFINNKKVFLHDLWKKRLETKFGGVSYPIQKGAEAIFSKQGKKEISQNIQIYKDNASYLRDSLINMGFTIYGGIDSPYIWWKIPKKYKSSWEFFDVLLKNANVITIPGSGFGPSGENFIRLSSFANKETLKKAIENINLSSLK